MGQQGADRDKVSWKHNFAKVRYNMIPTLNTVTAGGGLPLDQYIALAKRHGFSGVEFNIDAVADLVAKQSFETVASLFDSVKVLPAASGLPTEWRRDEETYRADLAKLPALAKLSQDLDCSRWCTWVMPATDEPASEYGARSIARFAEIGRILTDNGIRLGLEFLGPKHLRPNPDNVWFYDIPGALNVVEEIQTIGKLENMGLLVDCWHWYTSGGSVMDLASIPLEQIVHVHINDAPDVPREEQIDNVRLLPGATGVIDITGFLKTLSALGYDGPISVETFSADLNAMPAEEAAALAGAAVAGVFKAAGVEPMRLV